MNAGILEEPTKIKCTPSDLKVRILPLLRGRVFHVTRLHSFDSIRTDKLIKNSRDHRLLSPWKDSYGPKNGCVCLFDLRNATDEQIDEALLKYYFLSPFHGEEDSHVYLFISECAWSSLILERKGKGLAIPDVEVWYQGDVPINLISDILVVTGQFDSEAVQLREVYREALHRAQVNQKARKQSP